MSSMGPVSFLRLNGDLNSDLSYLAPIAEFEQYGTALLPPDLVGGITWNLLPQS